MPGEKVVTEFTLGRRYILILQISAGVLGLFFISFSFFVAVIFFLSIPVIGWYLRKSNAYCLSDKRILIHRGWLSTHLISIDYNKITDVSVKEPFFERLILKTGNLSVNTAGTGTQEVILTHIESPYEIKKRLDSIRTYR